MIRKIALAAGTALLLIALTACQQPTKGTTMTLDEAKADYFTVEAELLALIPADVVIEDLGHNEDASLLPCDSDPDLFTWPGAAAVTIAPDTDSEAVLDDIAGAWESKQGWTQKRDATSSGAPTLKLFRDDGLWFGISALEKNTQLHVSGFSACFALEDYQPLDRY